MVSDLAQVCTGCVQPGKGTRLLSLHGQGVRDRLTLLTSAVLVSGGLTTRGSTCPALSSHCARNETDLPRPENCTHCEAGAWSPEEVTEIWKLSREEGRALGVTPEVAHCPDGETRASAMASTGEEQSRVVMLPRSPPGRAHGRASFGSEHMLMPVSRGQVGL